MQTIKLLHYRNGIYQGQVKSNKRNGKGILVTDKGEIIVGTWKNDKLFGNGFMFLNQYQYMFGQFNRGQLQGWCKFESDQKILISQFNNSQPINKQLLINKSQLTYKITTPSRNGIYQILKQQSFPQNFQKNPSFFQQLPTKQLNNKLPSYFSYTLIQYIKEFFLINQKQNQNFEIQVLINGYIIFKLKDQASVVSLGFVINKNSQLISYGLYVNNKLSGFGCKYQNSTRYEGIFLNGFLNGEGLKYNGGKYSYGVFQNGTLTQPLYLQERSLASQQKLKQLKKLEHISNLNFSNQFLTQSIIRFKGIKQIIFQLALKQQYLFTQTPEKNMSATKVQKNNLGSKIKTSRQDIIETKSNISLISATKKNKNPEQQQSRVTEIGKSISNTNSIRRFNNNNRF